MKTTKHVNILVAVYYIIIVVAVSLVLNPIYSSVSTDILTKNTMWPGIIELFKSALEFAFYALIFSAIIYSNYISPKKKNYGVLLISVIGDHRSKDYEKDLNKKNEEAKCCHLVFYKLLKSRFKRIFAFYVFHFFSSLPFIHI